MVKAALKIWGVLYLFFAAFYLALTLYAASSPNTTFSPGPTSLGEWVGMGLLSLGVSKIVDLMEKK